MSLIAQGWRRVARIAGIAWVAWAVALTILAGELIPPVVIVAAVMMLAWLADRKGDKALAEAAVAVDAAVASVLAEGKVLTYDLGGSAKCSQVGDAVVEVLRAP